MTKYNEELPVVYIERELGNFIKEKSAVIDCTVGESILIMSATTNYANDLLQGLSEKWQRSLVIESAVELTKKLMIEKRGLNYEENAKTSKKNAIANRRTR